VTPTAGGARRAAAMIGTLGLFGCAAAPLTAEAPRIVTGMVLTPYEIREDCVRLSAGDRLDYTFDASDPVAFEIRYTQGTAALSPVVRAAVRTDAGIYLAPLDLTYCLVWEAASAGAIVDYRLRLRPAVR
jgi:hypothetical protein